MALLSYHSARRGFLGFLTYITGSDSVPRGGVLPGFVQVDTTGVATPAGTVGDPLFISGGSGGGAATLADGADVTQGAIADAVVAAGATGTLSAKLRRLTTDIGALILQIPASLGAKTGATSLSVVPNTDTPFPAVGNAASGATDSGNPIKIAGVFTSGAQPSYTTGQRGNANIDSRGNLKTFLVLTLAAGTDGYSNANMGLSGRDASDATLAMPQVAGYVFNGTTWDRTKKPNATARLISPAATTNATVAKASSGDLFKIFGNNTTATKRYLKIYNKATAPTVGTDTPVLTIPLPGSAAFDISITAGQYFATGIAYAITANAADADTTAISAGDIECLHLVYA